MTRPGRTARRLLLADHTKFDPQALHGLLPLADFDAVIVDEGTADAHLERMRRGGITVVVEPAPE